MNRLTREDLARIRDREAGAMAPDRTALLGHVGVLEEELLLLRMVAICARTYLRHDGSGLDEKGEWAGDHDPIDEWRARADLRDALTAARALEAPGG